MTVQATVRVSRLQRCSRMTPNETSTWNEIRRIAEQLELEIHLAGMEARDRWEKLQPRLVELEQKIEHTSQRAGELISEQLSSVANVLRELREDIAKRRRAADRS